MTPGSTHNRGLLPLLVCIAQIPRESCQLAAQHRQELPPRTAWGEAGRESLLPSEWHTSSSPEVHHQLATAGRQGGPLRYAWRPPLELTPPQVGAASSLPSAASVQ